MHYINNSIPMSVLAPQPHQQMVNIKKLLPPEPKGNSEHFQSLCENMTEEVKRDYYFSLKKSIGKKKCCTSLYNLICLCKK